MTHDDPQSTQRADEASAGLTQAAPDSQARAQAEAAVATSWNVGDVVLDLYEVIALLGEGGMGQVYKVHHRGWNVDLAVKTPRPEIFATTGGAANFIREAETWVNLGLHPHTVSCYYVRTLGGIPRVFAEYVDGGSLADWIHTKKLYEGGLEKALERILDIAIQFAWGLHYAHEQGLVHQDVKPANVMLTTDGVAKVTDFGLAKARALAKPAVGADPRVGPGAHHKSPAGTNPESRIPNPSLLVSAGGMTPAYCSPEQAAGFPLSRATDIWSWGLSILEMFTGEVTWLAGQAALEALESYRETGREDAAIPAMPEAIGDLLRTCFARTPDTRPPNMRDVAATLRQTFQKIAMRPYSRPESKAATMTADALNNRALSLLDLGKPAEAERAWSAAIEADAQHAATTYNRGILRWRRAEIEHGEVAADFESIRAAAAGQWLPSYLSALIALEAGELEPAAALLEEARRIDPGNRDVAAAFDLMQSGAVASSAAVVTLAGHQGGVRSVRFAADSRLLVSTGKDEAIRIWDAATGRCIQTLTIDGFIPWDASFFPDSTRLAVAGSSLRIVDRASGRAVRTFDGHLGPTTSVTLVGDGRSLLSGGIDATARLWDVDDGRCLRVLESESPPWATRVSASADGRRAVTAANTLVRVWDLDSGECLRTFEEREYVADAAIAPDGLALVIGQGVGVVAMRDVASGRSLGGFGQATGGARPVSLSPDSTWVLAGDGAGTCHLWLVSTARCARLFRGHSGPVAAVAFSADGRLAASGGEDGTIRVWRAPRAAEPVPPLHVSRVSSFAAVASAASRFAASLEAARTALAAGAVADALAHARTARALPGFERNADGLDAWARLTCVTRRSRLRAIWLSNDLRGPDNSIKALDAAGDGMTAIVATDHGTIESCDLRSGGREVIADRTAAQPMMAIGVTSDRTRAVTAHHNGTIGIWDLAARTRIRTLSGHADRVCDVAISADDRWLLSGGGFAPKDSDNSVRLWELATGRAVHVLRAHADQVKAVAISPDARWAASGGSDKIIVLWDLGAGRLMARLPGHTSSVTALRVTPDGRRVISGGLDKTIRVWDSASGRCLRVLEGHVVWCLGLSPDGRFALSGSPDETLRVWELETGACVQTLPTSDATVNAVHWSDDGRWIVAGTLSRYLKGTMQKSASLLVYEADWELQPPAANQWDEAARVHLEQLLTRRTPARAGLGRLVATLTSRRDAPSWTAEDLDRLMTRLRAAGYGWLNRDIVERKLKEMAAAWQGPLPLPKV